MKNSRSIMAKTMAAAFAIVCLTVNVQAANLTALQDTSKMSKMASKKMSKMDAKKPAKMAPKKASKMAPAKMAKKDSTGKM